MKGGPSDLHVLGTPPAFTLSQDQTLHHNAPRSRGRTVALERGRTSRWFSLLPTLRLSKVLAARPASPRKRPGTPKRPRACRSSGCGKSLNCCAVASCVPLGGSFRVFRRPGWVLCSPLDFLVRPGPELGGRPCGALPIYPTACPVGKWQQRLAESVRSACHARVHVEPCTRCARMPDRS